MCSSGRGRVLANLAATSGGPELAVRACGAACNLTAITIKATVDGTREFTQAKSGEFADPELVGPVLAAGVVTAEGTLYYVPDYEPLLVGTIFSNIGYGNGWLQASALEAELNGKYNDEAERYNGAVVSASPIVSVRMAGPCDDSTPTVGQTSAARTQRLRRFAGLLRASFVGLRFAAARSRSTLRCRNASSTGSFFITPRMWIAPHNMSSSNSASTSREISPRATAASNSALSSAICLACRS